MKIWFVRCGLVCLSLVLSFTLIGCGGTEGTAGAEACSDVTCPTGTAPVLEAEAESACSAGAGAGGGLTSVGASASASCVGSGSCSLICEPVSSCCGGENWTDGSYSCETPCVEAACGNDECESGEDPDSCPQDCAANCGNGECEYGETCVALSCQDQTDCDVCMEDCCPVCGNGECEFPEGGETGADPCDEDCGGEDTCVPDCGENGYCGDDGCGGSCEAVCPGGFYCNEDDQCTKFNGGDAECPPHCPDGMTCVDGACKPACPEGCPDGMTCVNNKCESTGACTPDCNMPNCGNDDGCGGMCTCPESASCVNNKCEQNEECVPSCVAPNCGGDGCGGSCADSCPNGTSCVNHQCEPDGGDDTCAHSGQCEPYEHCTDGVCEVCMPKCSETPCNDPDCYGCGLCPGAKVCNDLGECVNGG